jgi:hypothetical protein
MLHAGAMARRAAYIVLGCLVGAVFLSREARADNPAIAAPSSLYQPARTHGTPRPDNQNPYAINNADCTANVQLTFDLRIQGFTGSAASDTVQVWASLGDRGCWQDSTRMNGTAQCWPVLASSVVPTGASITFPPISAWDIIGPQWSSPTTYTTYQQRTADACSISNYTSFAHQEFFLYFLPITSNGLFDTTGAYYQYKLDVALLGPAPPTLQPTGVGDTFLVANWVPNPDTETVGYDVFLDPFPGSSSPMASPTTCGDAGTTPPSDASTSGDAAGSGGSSTAGVCYDSNLVGSISPSSGSSVDAGSSSDAGNGGEGGASSEGGTTTSQTGNGGIATFMTSSYLLNRSAGMTVTGASVSTYSITGLQNCTNYKFAVSAVDGYGNIGPPSPATVDSCGWPQPTGDFWQTYRASGGQAGGFCALEAVGASPHSLAALALMAGGVAVAASRRRRRAR